MNKFFFNRFVPQNADGIIIVYLSRIGRFVYFTKSFAFELDSIFRSFLLEIVYMSGSRMVWPAFLALGVASIAARTGLRAAQRHGLKLPKFDSIQLRDTSGFESKMSNGEARKILNLSISNASPEKVSRNVELEILVTMPVESLELPSVYLDSRSS